MLVFLVILLPALLAGLGLVIDNGLAFDLKRRLQKAADAGALAAAHELRLGSPTTVTKVAMDNTARNGFAVPATDVQVYNPPKTGKRAGDSDFVEVVVRHEAPLFFMKPIYSSDLMVEARAIAGVSPARTCIIALNKTASPGLLVSGNAHVDVSQCGVQVDSDAAKAAVSGGNATLKASRVDVVGKYSGGGFTPTPRTESPYLADPLAELPDPPIGPCLYNNLKLNNSMTLAPGTYCGGLTVTAGAVATLEKGVHVLKGGGLDVQGGGTVKGDEVMIYNTASPYAPITFGGGAVAQLTAPKDGPYEGILFFTDRKVSGGKTNLLIASSDSHFTGTLYFPTTPLTFTGGAELVNQKILIIADTIEFQGNCMLTAPTVSDGISWYQREAALVY